MSHLYGGIDIPGKPDPINIQRLDILPLPQIARMMSTGICIDRERLWSLSSRLESSKSDLRLKIASYVPSDKLEEFVSDSEEIDELNVESSQQISDLLFDQLEIGKGEKLKTTKSGKRLSAGKKQLETLKRRHPIIPLILAYREASKLKSMIKTVVDLAKPEGDLWTLHTEIVSTRTATGRLASRKPNLQNIGARSDLGREFRSGFVPRPGKVLISSDFSQIELRLLAHGSQDANMLRIFASGGDIHTDTAMRAFDLPEDKVDKLLHRAPCKNCNFGICFGLGPLGLLDLMALTYATANKELPVEIDLAWCERFISTWFGLYPKARDYFDIQHYRARRYGIVWTPFGRVRRIPEMLSCHERIRQAGLRQAGNMPIQGMAADVFKIAMARVERLLSAWRDAGVYVEALLPVHDELVIECDPKWADEIKDLVIMEMQRALVDDDGVLQCRCPILADGKVMTGGWEK